MNYANEISIYGMLPKTAIINTPLTFYKSKKRKEIVSFSSSFVDENRDVSYRYVEKPEKLIKGCFKEKEITQGIFNKKFFELKGKKYKHLRNLCNKYDKNLVIKDKASIEEIKALLINWKNSVGLQHYGWNTHIGYDERFFEESVNIIKDEVIPLFFYLKNELVGYAIFDKGKEDTDGIYNFTYLLGKYDPAKLYSNLSRYLDFKAYEYLFKNFNRNFKVNLGTASKGLLKYKMQTFPVYKMEYRYFYKVKRVE